MALMASFTHTTNVYSINLFMKNLFARTYFYLSESLIICAHPWESFPIYDHHENLSLFMIITRIFLYLWSSWESFSIHDHHENLFLPVRIF